MSDLCVPSPVSEGLYVDEVMSRSVGASCTTGVFAPPVRCLCMFRFGINIFDTVHLCRKIVVLGSQLAETEQL